jgi:hypothetical protein
MHRAEEPFLIFTRGLPAPPNLQALFGRGRKARAGRNVDADQWELGAEPAPWLSSVFVLVSHNARMGRPRSAAHSSAYH